MHSLMSCLPQELIRSIEADEEVTILFLRELWPQLVGEELACKTKPTLLRKKVLQVRVPSAVWASQLAGLRTIMIGSINRIWGTQVVETIRLEYDL